MLELTAFTIESELHAGGNARVFRGWRKVDGKAVILKVPAARAPSPRQLARWTTERELLTELAQVPGVLHLLAFEKQHGVPILITEDVDGGVWGESRRDLRETIQVAIAVAETLSLVHDAGITHRNISPTNIIVGWDDGIPNVRLIDFAIASRLPRETLPWRSPSELEGTLATMAPEQTGRVNRPIDHRADLYALGATLYERLTGKTLFGPQPPLELVRSHVARSPVPVLDIEPTVPAALAAIVEKLIAKAAEHRYQSAMGLVTDLRACLEQLDRDGTVGDIPLAVSDVPRKLYVSQTAYASEAGGRELAAALDRVREQPPELVLITGEDDIDRATLVAELYRPLTAQRGYFAVGRSQQFHRDTRYAALAQALGDLAHQVRVDHGPDLAVWSAEIAAAVEDGGRLLTDLVPELKVLIGEQPAAAAGTPSELEARLGAAVLAFLNVFASHGRPVAVFLDDMQWIDGGSLSLLKRLLSSSSRARQLLFVGGYRKSEVDAAHPLQLALDSMLRADVPVHALAVEPLTAQLVRRLLADTLRSDSLTVANLADFVFDKTRGDPIFVTQLLLHAHSHGLVRFKAASRGWEWNVSRLENAAIPDDVTALLIAKLIDLPPATEAVIHHAACIGMRFHLDVLAVACGQSSAAVKRALQPALSHGFLLPDVTSVDEEGPTAFRFLHSRMREAVEATIAADDGPKLHAEIGRRLLRAALPSERAGAHPVAVLEHFRAGAAFITDASERLLVAGHALDAGRRAKASFAYRTSQRLLGLAVQLLPASAWTTHYESAFATHFELGQCDYLAGDLQRSLARLELVLQHARTTAEKAEVYGVLAQLHLTRSRYVEAFSAGVSGLRELGVEVELDPAKVGAIEDEVSDYLQRRDVDALVAAPQLKDPQLLSIAQQLASVPSYYAGPAAFRALQVGAAHFSMRNGQSQFTALAYLRFGAVLAEQGRHALGYEISRRAFELTERVGTAERLRTARYVFATFMRFRGEHFSASAASLSSVIDGYLELGDTLMTTWAVQHRVDFLLLSGSDVALAHAEAARQLGAARDVSFDEGAASLEAIVGFCAFLMGAEADDKDPKARAKAAKLEQDIVEHHSEMVRNYYLFYQSWRQYLAGQFDDALATLERAKQCADALHGTVRYEDHHFLEALIATALVEHADDARWALLGPKVRASRERLESLARSAPMNYRHRCLLIDAEIARIEGRSADAEDLYDDTIQTAEEHGFRNIAVIASERAGRWYLASHNAVRALGYLTAATRLYEQWNAHGKARQLKALYGDLVVVANASEATHTDLDLVTVTRSLKAIASELRFDQLLALLMRILIANAGAERGFVILAEQESLVVQAGKESGDADVVSFEGRPLAGFAGIAEAIVRRVAATTEEIVLANAAVEMPGVDPHIERTGVKSLLCLPGTHQGKLVGVIYLENNLVEGCFTAARLEVLRILASQMAVSVENAGLYSHLEETVQQRTKEALQKDLAYTAAVQTLFLPSQPGTDAPSFRLRGHYWPAPVCTGDWWWHDSRGDEARLLVGDVTGRGGASAMITASIASCYRMHTTMHPQASLEESLAAVHDALGAVAKGNVLMSMSAASLKGDQLRWYNAGGPPIVVVEPDGTCRVLSATGAPLGTTAPVSLVVDTLQLVPGARVALFSDGITELRGPEGPLDPAWLCASLLRARHLDIDAAMQAVLAELRALAGGAALADDITLALLEPVHT